jgi:hypothetical protein
MAEPAVAEATTDETPQPETTAPAPATERPEVEVVEPQPAVQTPAVPEPPSALERAAHELMETPGAPGRDEFLVLATTARVLSMSAGAPAAIRNNPWLAFHLALIGRDLGISPSAAIAQVDVIGYNANATTDAEAYKNAQLSLSPELLNGQIRRLGLGSIVKAASSTTSCVAVALLPGGRVDVRCARTWPEHVDDDRRPCSCTFDRILGEVEFTWADAQQAGLADGACVGPDQHTAACVNGGSGTRGKRCHQGYRAYPQRMMWWRAAGWCQSDYFPEAGVGLYSPEELGAVVDPETGRPVDPASVALPDGYEVPEAPHNPANDLLADAEDGTELAETRADLRQRIDAILAAGDAAKAALRELWEKEDGEGFRLTPPFPHLQRRHVTRARAVVKSVEDQLKGGRLGDDAKQAWGDATVAAAGFGAGRGAVEPQEPAGDADAEDDAAGAGDADGAREQPQGDDLTDQQQAALDQYDRDVADSEFNRKLRAQQTLEQAGLEPQAPAAVEPQPISDDDLVDEVTAVVKAYSPTEVLEVIRRYGEEPNGSLPAQRKRLAELIYTAERATRPQPQA